MASPPGVSVILPSYNERENIVLFIDAIHREMEDCDHEILVIDDGSPDGTCAALAALADDRVKVLLNSVRVGLGRSIRRGLEEAKGEMIVIMDSDFDHNPGMLRSLVYGLGRFDCVLVSRFFRSSVFWRRPRYVLSWIFNILLRKMTGIKITDSLYGFFAVKRGVIQQCPYSRIFWGHGDYGMRLCYYLQENNSRILELPAVLGKRRCGKGNRRLPGTFCRYLAAVVNLTWLRFKNNV